MEIFRGNSTGGGLVSNKSQIVAAKIIDIVILVGMNLKETLNFTA